MSSHRELLDRAMRDRDTVVSLYYLPGRYQPYATWIASPENPEVTFHGHYFESLADAQEDFEKRSVTQEQRNRVEHVLIGFRVPYEERQAIRKDFYDY